MPELIPVDFDPFAVKLEPVDHDPWAAAGTPGPGQMTDADRAQVRHAVDATVGPLLDRLTAPGRSTQGVQTETPGTMTEADAFRQNQLDDELQKWGARQALTMASGGINK